MFVLFATFMGSVDEPADEDEVRRLVRAARLGNRSAAQRLYALHVARVFRLVRPLCASEHDAEDATQDAFIDALGNLNRYADRPGQRFISWLATLALNRARKRWRRARRGGPAGQTGSDAVDDGAALEEAPTRRKLLELLAKLPERDRLILSLRYGAGLTADEVADVSATSPANVRKVCERRRRELLDHFAAPPQEASP